MPLLSGTGIGWKPQPTTRAESDPAQHQTHTRPVNVIGRIFHQNFTRVPAVPT